MKRFFLSNAGSPAVVLDDLEDTEELEEALLDLQEVSEYEFMKAVELHEEMAYHMAYEEW